MLTAKIHDGRIEPEQPIPDGWEGLTVQILPLLPEELTDDLEQRLALFHGLGATEFADGEVQQILGLSIDIQENDQCEAGREFCF